MRIHWSWTLGLVGLACCGGAWASGGWDYQGPHGPDHWGELNPDFALCKGGQEQSPINIGGAVPNALPKLQFVYGLSRIHLVNNGHTIQFNYDAGSQIKFGDETYDLLQFHFHTPSEEMIAGKRSAMVAHLVHKNQAGKLLVVAVLFEAGKENAFLSHLWERMPMEHGETRIFEDARLSVAALLPLKQAYYTFMGSLTTPPCSEGVRWVVLKQPVSLSAKQLEHFKREYPMNARPIQKQFDRIIMENS